MNTECPERGRSGTRISPLTAYKVLLVLTLRNTKQRASERQRSQRTSTAREHKTASGSVTNGQAEREHKTDDRPRSVAKEQDLFLTEPKEA